MTPEPTAVPAASHPNAWPESHRPMSLGLMVPIGEGSAFGGAPRFADMVEITRTAEAVGFDIGWYADHFAFDRPGPETHGIWECWTMMAGVAAATERIGIGSLVACTGFRNPGVIAKMTEAIDEISNGRMILGLGAGWHRPEYEMFGFPWDHRVSRFEEAVEIIAPMLREKRADFAGDFFTAAGMVNQPRGPRPHGAPILVGSSGPRMLRTVARHADAWNTVWHNDPAATVPLLAAVDAACAEAGRDPATLVRTAGGNIALTRLQRGPPGPDHGDAERIAATIRGFRDLGFRHFVCGIDPCTPASVEWFARVIEMVDAD